jgi:hypothetical protein
VQKDISMGLWLVQLVQCIALDVGQCKCSQWGSVRLLDLSPHRKHLWELP